MKDMNSYIIPADRLPLVQDLVAKVARKAAKIQAKGVLADITPIGIQVGERSTRKVMGEGGVERREVFFHVTITGSAPRLAGWTFVATLQHEEEGTVIRTVPTVELEEGALKAYRAAKPVCDHCDIKRKRNDTFIVRNEVGDLKQVGRNCLGDFLGTTSPQDAARLADLLTGLDEVLSDGSWGGGSGPIVADLEEYLGYVARSMRENGWLSRTAARAQDRGHAATANQAWQSLFPMSPDDRKHALVPETEDAKRAEQALAWAENFFEGRDLNDFEHNLHIITMGGTVTYRTAGIAASLISCWERETGRQLERERAKKERRVSTGYLGTPGKREIFRARLEGVISLEGQYGVTTIHRFYTVEGQLLIWKTGSARLEVGTEYEIKGTVKEHSLYREEMQTVLSRCAATAVPAVAA